MDRFYGNKDLLSFQQEDDGSIVRVYPYTLSDHHPIKAQIAFNENVGPPIIREDKFLLNTSLLKDMDVRCVIYMIQQVNK